MLRNYRCKQANLKNQTLNAARSIRMLKKSASFARSPFVSLRTIAPWISLSAASLEGLFGDSPVRYW
jgi:hypothetical protein